MAEWKKGTHKKHQQQAEKGNWQHAKNKRNGFIYLRANGNQTTIYEIY